MLYTSPDAYETIYELYVTILKTSILIAVGCSLLVSMDRLAGVFKYLYISGRSEVTGRRPENRFKFTPLPDPNQYPQEYPKVAIQLPMFNERAVCQAIIDAACELSWPSESLMVQVWTVHTMHQPTILSFSLSLFTVLCLIWNVHEIQ